MSKLTTQQLEEWTGGQWLGLDYLKESISGFCYDTRGLKRGEIFVALVTEANDGHNYLIDALNKGASMAIVQTPNFNVELPQLCVADSLSAWQRIATHYRKLFKGPVVGVTGSCGKTSTKDLLKILLGEYQTLATKVNLNNTLGVPYTITQVDADKHNFAVIEAGMNVPGEMSTISQIIQPDVAVITLVAPCHLAGIGDIEGIAREKALLAQAVHREGRVFFPYSCLQYEVFQRFHVPVTVVVPPNVKMEKHFPEDECYCLTHEAIDAETSRIKLANENGVVHEFTFPSTNQGMISNAALAILTALHLGVDDAMIQERLLQWRPSFKRGQIFVHGNQYYYSDCYNANPVSMINAIEHFQVVAPKDKEHVYVLGCMGELAKDSAQLHYETGYKIRVRPQDQVIIVRNEVIEQAEVLRRGLIDGGNSEDQIIVCLDRQEALRYTQFFDGAIFLKGSKAVKLWELLPEKYFQTHLQTT